VLFVVRHAKAGSRHEWDGDDDSQRPLTKPGRRQAAALVERLRAEPVTAVWSSPYLRCTQTVEPLAAALGLDVHTDARLGEGRSFEGALAVLREVPDGTVLCSHGDVIPDLLLALARRGTELRTPPDWRKASIWLLDAPDAEGHVGTAAAEPPPDV
jgi:8-oxo-dGTP diphosphatase